MRDDVEVEITAVRREADRIISIDFAPVAPGRLPRWEPGAHVEFRLPSGAIRQYSLCGDPQRPESYRVAVLREDEGRGGSVELHGIAAPGARLAVPAIRQNFPLEPAPSLLFLAGGIGVTPILPMTIAAERAGTPWRLVYGARSREAMAFLDRLGRFEQVELWPEETRGRPDLRAAIGSVEPGTGIYCCGPAGMIELVETLYRELAVDASLHIERFSGSGEVDASGDAFEVVLAQSDLVLTVPPDATILDVLLGAGVDADYSCQEGHCGTCQVGVLDGIPDHRDEYLTDDEKASNEYIMVCSSRCIGKRLTLDL